MKIKDCLRILWGLALFVPTLGLAQPYHIEKIDLVKMVGFYRIMIQCDGPVVYVDRFEEDSGILSIYLRDTQLALGKTDYRFQTGGIELVTAIQWKRRPLIARVEISLQPEFDYEISKRFPSLVYVDIKRAANETQKYDSKNYANSYENGVSVNEVNAKDAAIQFAPRDLLYKSHDLNKSKNNLPKPLSSVDRITLDVNAAELSNVLRLLAKQTTLNIVASRDVTGKVTVSLRDVTIKEALDIIVKANGLDYIIEGEVILVKPREKFELPELETKVYRLKYIDANNLEATISQMLSSQAKVQVFYGNFNPEKTAVEGQEATQKNRSSTLIVTDSPQNILQLNAIIATLDVPAPQIMIEAKLIEISPQHDENIGIDWSKAINAEIFSEVLLPGGSPQRFVAEVPLEGGGINYGTLSFGQYNAVINFLNTNTNTKLVSNPRIMTMDNQEAIISVGTTFPIPKINRGVGGQGDVVTFEYRDVNITLRVTPHVSGDDIITLFVNPEVEEVIGEVAAGGNSAPITSKREVETVVHLKNNETMVIGGLIRENTIETLSKVWLLGDIPLIGNLFRNKNKTRRQTDLLIFITPRLVDAF